jgi:hypothetical protein
MYSNKKSNYKESKSDPAPNIFYLKIANFGSKKYDTEAAGLKDAANLQITEQYKLPPYNIFHVTLILVMWEHALKMNYMEISLQY